LPAQNLGIPHETYVTMTFILYAPLSRSQTSFLGVADMQHSTVRCDDKAAAAV
jgi:hypothetical protein